VTRPDITDKSLIVVAHPDDEVLWFSSVLADVDGVVMCYQDVASQPAWTAGRRESMRTHPLRNVDTLELPESEVFDGAAWPDPLLADYGLQVERSRGWSSAFSLPRYRSNFNDLKRLLRVRLHGYKNVFTHNPWGEYGHEEHVQVFRAVDVLREEMGFQLWFSNYCSIKSHGLMLQYMKAFEGCRREFEPRRDLCESLKALYERNGCWTWFADYEWPRAEAFLRWDGVAHSLARPGTVTPMNLIGISASPKRPARNLSFRALPGRVLRSMRLHLKVSE